MCIVVCRQGYVFILGRIDYHLRILVSAPVVGSLMSADKLFLVIWIAPRRTITITSRVGSEHIAVNGIQLAIIGRYLVSRTWTDMKNHTDTVFLFIEHLGRIAVIGIIIVPDNGCGVRVYRYTYIGRHVEDFHDIKVALFSSRYFGITSCRSVAAERQEVVRFRLSYT